MRNKDSSFNENFISIAVKERSNRFTTLFSITGMLDHFLFDPSEFDRKREYLFQDIDWTEANARLHKEIARSRAWLKEALEKPRREPADTMELLNTMSVELERTRYQLERLSALRRKKTLLIKYWICRLANAIRRRYAANVLYYKQKLSIAYDVPDDRLLPWIYTKIVKSIVRKCRSTLVCRTKNLLRGTRDR